MIKYKCFLVFCALTLVSTYRFKDDDKDVHVQYREDGKGLELWINHGKDSNVRSVVNVIPKSSTKISSAFTTAFDQAGSHYTFEWGTLQIKNRSLIDNYDYHIIITAGAFTTYQMDIDFGETDLYGGPMRKEQVYPFQKASFAERSYISSPDDNAAIVERYWVTSEGAMLYISPETPLFFSYNENKPNLLTITTEAKPPFRRQAFVYEYRVVKLFDLRTAHLYAASNGFIGKPDPDMIFSNKIKEPMWSTRVQLGKKYSDSQLIDFANEIKSHNIALSNVVVEDWEGCPGTFEASIERFSNFSNTLSELVAQWPTTVAVHPFVNSECNLYDEGIFKSFFVSDAEGNTDVQWSHGAHAGMIDFTNLGARLWWQERVEEKLNHYGMYLKCDGGEIGYFPGVAELKGDPTITPLQYGNIYSDVCARYRGSQIKTRFGKNGLAIPVEIPPRDSVWGIDNGLASVITTTLLMNTVGYPNILPDIIGGNGVPSKELFIRWVQVNCFLPIMQFSYFPWNYDAETEAITKKYIDLHRTFVAPRIMTAFAKSAMTGAPVNGPLWWIAPKDNNTFAIADQFLLDEDVIVAPVIVEGATSRDIYLPVGKWLEQNDPRKIHLGPIWLKNHNAPLDTLPYFVRATAPLPDNGASTLAVGTFTTTLGVLIIAILDTVY